MTLSLAQISLNLPKSYCVYRYLILFNQLLTCACFYGRIRSQIRIRDGISTLRSPTQIPVTARGHFCFIFMLTCLSLLCKGARCCGAVSCRHRASRGAASPATPASGPHSAALSAHSPPPRPMVGKRRILLLSLITFPQCFGSIFTESGSGLGSRHFAAFESGSSLLLNMDPIRIRTYPDQDLL